MNEFIELTLRNEQKIVLNVHSTQSIYDNEEGTVIGMSKGNCDVFIVCKPYDEIKHKLIPSTSPKKEHKPKVGR